VTTHPFGASPSAKTAVEARFLGNPQALALVVKNRTDEILQQARVVLKDLLKWAPDHKKFIQVREYHDGGAFPDRALVGPNQFFPDSDETFQFLRLTSRGFVCEGPLVEGAGNPLPVNGRGVWMATFDVHHAGSSCVIQLFFERPESGGAPMPAEDPRR
jgi:hypothetical protein